MNKLEASIILLETTLGNMSSKDADSVVEVVINLLNEFQNETNNR